MKKSILFISYLLLFGLFTQIQAQTVSTTLFFEPGQHQLNKASKTELQRFILSIKDFKDFDLDLKAYTDDIGSTEYNQKLAARRAASVTAFLAEFAIAPAYTEVEGVGEIELTKIEDAKAERRQNRRVEVVATAFQPHSLDDVYSYFINRRTGQKVIDITQDNVIFGPKGTEVYIPKNSLQLVGGGEIDFNKVELTLQEAYDNSAMIMHNLTTMSDGELIETAGMIYLDAKTLDGRAVEIRPEAELMVGMPSPAVLPSDMQLFTAERTQENLAKNINWNATGQNFLSTNFNNKVPTFDFEGVDFKMLPKVTSPNLSPWPQKVEKPTAPIKPILQADRETTAATLEEIIAKNPHYEGESDRKYKARMESTFENAKLQANKNISYNANKLAYFETQMAAYKVSLSQYEQKKVEYDAYESKVIAIKQELFDKREDLKAWFSAMHWADNGFETEMTLMLRSYKQFLKLKTYLEFECNRLEMNGELDYVKNAELKQAKLIMTLGVKFLNCARLNKEFDKAHSISATAHVVDEILTSPTYNELALFEADGAPRNVEKLYRSIIGMYHEAKIQNTVVENYNEILKLSDFKDNARKLDSLCLSFTKIQEDVLTAKIERGWMSTSELRANFNNMARINKLGWINCDRFIGAKRGERRVELTVKDELLAQEEQVDYSGTQYYAIFKSVRGIMSFYPLKNKPDTFVSFGVPEGEKVKIVGIRVKEDQVEVGIYEGTAKDIKNLKLHFSAKNLKELRYLL